MRLRGWIGSGRGDASKWLQHPSFTALLGPFYPGTLNVYVPGEHHHAPHHQNYPDPGYLKRQGFFAVRRCMVQDIEGWLFRCEYPGPTHTHAAPIRLPHTMFEVIASAHIAGLSYGTDVAVEFEPGDEHLATLPWVDVAP